VNSWAKILTEKKPTGVFFWSCNWFFNFRLKGGGCFDCFPITKINSSQLQRSTATMPLPYDLSDDLWYIILGYLWTLDDWASIRLVCRAFCGMMNDVCEYIRILPVDFGSRYLVICPNYTPVMVARGLLRFVTAGNPDALLLLSWISLYCMNDVQTGVALLNKGVQQHDCHAMYELGLLLAGDPSHTQRQMGYCQMDEAARYGHGLSKLLRYHCERDLYNQAVKELCQMRCLLPMIAEKMRGSGNLRCHEHCANPFCPRVFCVGGLVNVNRDLGVPYPMEWQQMWCDFMAHGVLVTETATLYRPRGRCCERCRRVWYCGLPCQRLHTREHKPACDVLVYVSYTVD